ncbi:MAG: pyrrolo-quinoline quinone [Planctomycetes bacterium]|nr:pyrrolo-quinoline quinone [Planctomycetota bacterium]
MNPISARIALVLSLLAVPLAAQDAKPVRGPARDTNWPQFRGAYASGIANGFPTPLDFDVASGKNIQWRVAVPGLAHSSPIVWGERIYLTTAVRKAGESALQVGLYGDVAPVPDEGEHLFQVLCLDRKDGKVLWTQTAFDGTPRFPRHTKGSFAASTPATDGEHVVAMFGTEGLFCYAPDGKLLWKKDFGELDAGWYVQTDASWGFSASPVIHEGVLYLQVDVQKGSFVAALKLNDGSEIWRVPREDVPTFGAPTVDVREKRRQLVCNGFKHMGGYDLATGKELWKLEGGGDIPVPTPIVGGDLIYITNSHRGSPVFAIDAMAEGTLKLDPKESPHMRWSDPRRGNYMQTPIVTGEFLYCCRDNGVLACLDAAGGEVVYEERLGSGISGFTSSGVAADGKLYFASEEGVVYCVAEGFEFKQLGKSELGEECMASPAVSRGVLYYRTRGHLTAIAAR